MTRSTVSHQSGIAGGSGWVAALLALVALLGLVPTAHSYVLIQPANAWGKPDYAVPWRLNTFHDDLTIANEFDIIRAAWSAWITAGNVDIAVLEGPPITTSSPCGLTTNDINHISMRDCLSQCTGGCLAVTSTSLFQYGDGFWNPNTVADTLLLARQESDITFSKSANINWEDHEDWPPCPTGGFDLPGVCIHEMGHFFGLGHSLTGSATMFASIAPCDSTKASLHADDKRGIRVLYRAPGPEIAVTTMTAGNATLSVTNKGNLGYTGPGGKWGDSFQFGPLGATEHFFECSFALAQVGGAVSDNFRTDASTADGGDGDFQQASDLVVSLRGGPTDQQAEATFDDHRAESPYDVSILSRFFADNDAPNNDFVIAEYQITNEGGSTLSNMRAALFADVDYNNQFGSNSVSYEADRDLAVVSTPNTANVIGVTPVNVEGAVAMRALFATDTTPPENYSDTNKETWMSAGFERTSLGPADIALLIVSGNFTIPAGGTVTAAFAILGGNNLTDLRANALQAQIFYQTVINPSTNVEDGRTVAPVVSLSPNQPNPFSGKTRLEYTLLGGGPVRLDVLDASGRVVRNLVDGQGTKGQHSVIWDGTDGVGHRVPAGVYFSRLQSANGSRSVKMLLMR